MKREAELLLKQVGEKDMLVLFDEGGRVLHPLKKNFATHLGRILESGKSQITFVSADLTVLIRACRREPSALVFVGTYV